MQDFVKRMIDEHANLLIKIDDLIVNITTNGNNINKDEYSNMNVRLVAMKIYRDSLETSLNNYGITFNSEDCTYHEKVAMIDNDGDCLFKPVEPIEVEVSIEKKDNSDNQGAKHGN